ncbi:pitrilysin family protein [Candidatus Thioglobus autotrophicus]|uniref:M16 family metallopeptidase n=1 Tax=Candidatus Thioglobus autotrophicus TaxID=1705394 RepID=UPI00299E1B8F|nr:pitrilysin family protein [Candidatus Thioglobus autotrophicus]WPE16886.1 pitrilysin family protein [Candidatus Thioglobus autotrophicus]
MKLLALLLLLITQVEAKVNIEQWYTPEGAKVLFTQTQGLPMLDVALNFDAASSRDGEKHGLASLTNSLIGTASKYRSEEQIINQFESLGSEFSTASLKDMSIISMRSLTRRDILQSSLDLFTEVVSKVDYQQRYLSREKKQTLRAIEAAKQSPGSVANTRFNELVFGEHPYAHKKIGTQESLQQIKLIDLKQHYQRYYVAKNLTIALVGDISKAHAKQIARQISHGLNSGQKARDNQSVLPLSKAMQEHIEFPSTQTHLLIGQVGINRAHPDYYALYLGNHILGGSGLTSILSDEVREQRGLAYSTSSYFTKMKSNGYFLIKLQTKNSQADQAKKVALETLKNFRNNAIDAQKLQDGKDNIIGGFALETASNANILTYLSIIGFYELPLDFLNAFIDKITPISVYDIQKAYKRLINMDKLVVLSVGAKK